MNVLKKILWGIYRLRWMTDSPKRMLAIEQSVKKPCVILIGTPEYCNLGDHLIAYAAQSFLEKTLIDLDVVEITRELYEAYSQRINNLFQCDSIKAIFITGGGFIGSLWEQMDDVVLNILSVCKNKKVIILPQTIFYELGSVERFSKDKHSFESVEALKIFVRDITSYKYSIESGLVSKDRVLLKPDMAMFLYPYKVTEQVREGIAFCLRRDRENTLVDSQIKALEKIFSEGDQGNIAWIETVDKYKSFLPYKRKSELDMFAKLVSSKNVVVTNRLHCMVFCFLTNTPCIAIDNISHKISGVYEWIKDCDYIRCVTSIDIEEIYKEYQRLTKNTVIFYNDSKLKNEYDEMIKEIQKEVYK